MRVELREIDKSLSGKKIIDSFNLTADRQFVTILGPSGCGKTTILRIIAGFYRPDRGRIFFDDEDILQYDTRSGIWLLVYDGSAAHAVWEAADLDALHNRFVNDCRGDLDDDGDVDGSDNAEFAKIFTPADLSGFAAEFGRTDCLD